MKRFLFLCFLIASLLPAAKAQISVQINIGQQPLWGPVGYDRADYYYMPDIDTYYYVPKQQFIYQGSDGRWIFSSSLPSRYAGYNLYNGYKVVLNGPRPYLNYKTHKQKYARYKGVKGQPVIRYSSNPKYFVVKGHPKFGTNPGQVQRSLAPAPKKGQVTAPGQSQVYVSGQNGKGQGNKDKGQGKGRKN